jgi:succinoglycan biosynthesis protein ExoO
MMLDAGMNVDVNPAAARPQNSKNRDVRLSAANPDVTFLIAAFDVAPFIEEAVRSALAQRGVSVEVIVVDDASRDGTADIVARLAAEDSRVVLIRQKQNCGPGAARNAALKRARGQWISILDGDDFILPERSSALIACANATGADIVGDNFERVSVAGSPTGRCLFSPARLPYLFSVDAAAFIDANQVLGKRKFSLGAIKVIVRSEFLARHAVEHVEDLPVGEDFQFILACLFRGARFVVSSENGYKYRLRPGSQSWRLTSAHIEKFRRAHAAILRDASRFGDARAIDAVAGFGRSLERTADFVNLVSLAKSGAWKKAMSTALRRPRAWPLIVKYGSEALANRLRRFAVPAGQG